MSPPPIIDLDGLGLDRGGHLLLKHGLAQCGPGGRVVVRGRDPALRVHVPAWCRAHGHRVVDVGAAGAGEATLCTIECGRADRDRWTDSVRAGDARAVDSTLRPDDRWGLAARGALIESGGPTVTFELDDGWAVWADIAPRLYAQAAAAQWDPATAINWDAPIDTRGDIPEEIEDAVVQIMTYLVENEQAALVVPARFVGRIHPYFREVVQLLAVQIADEARHIEVFARRAGLHRTTIGVSGAGGRASLATLLAEPDFALASFLLSVLGEGSFLNLLAFLERNAPDVVTAQITRLALQDEARHVAFGVAHLERHVAHEPALRDRLRAAIERRHAALRDTAGLNVDVFDALVLLAAGSWDPQAVGIGFARVQALELDMAEGRTRRLVRLGFGSAEAADLSALHTRNFM